jgi:hypothetical protein
VQSATGAQASRSASGVMIVTCDPRIAAPRQNVQGHVGGMGALVQRFSAAGLDRRQPVARHGV